MKRHDKQWPASRADRSQRGAVALIVGLSMFVLVGFAGLAIDLARLYVNKAELQSAADACALAAAAELSCTAVNSACITRARAAGQFAASRDKSNLQSTAVAIADADVRFSTSFVPNGNYLAAGPNNSRYAMCIARSGGITPWFMGVLGVGASVVTSAAVASRQPSSAGGGFCPGVPIGVCQPAAGGNYAPGNWVAAKADSGVGPDNDPGFKDPTSYYAGKVQGTFRWVDWDYPGGGTNEVAARLAGSATACGITPTSGNIAEEGVKQGAKEAWNTRFGIYRNNGYTAQTAPPDWVGYSYPAKLGGVMNPDVGGDAIGDYMSKLAGNNYNPFQGTGGQNAYVPQGGGGAGNINGSASTLNEHRTYGSNRRLVAVPIVNGCGGAGTPVTVSKFGCFLMLNPMSNGSNKDIFLQYVGPADAPDSPCVSAGSPGGPGGGGGGGGGALVPTLVQ